MQTLLGNNHVYIDVAFLLHLAHNRQHQGLVSEEHAGPARLCMQLQLHIVPWVKMQFSQH